MEEIDKAFVALTANEKRALAQIACQNQTDEQLAAALGGDGPAPSERLLKLIAREVHEDPADKRHRWDLARFARDRIPVLLDEARPKR